MLTYEDEPTIRNAINLRLGTEPGVKIIDLHIKPRLKDTPPHIRVGIRAQLGSLPLCPKSRFDLPAVFEHSQLLNEIDQIAEQYKAVRRAFFANGGVPLGVEVEVEGTGVRGLWPA